MRKFPSLRPFLGILVSPSLASTLSAVLWYFLFFRQHFNVGKGDETALTNTLIPVLATFHSILAAAVLSKVWEEFKVIRRCVQNNDATGFYRCLQDRIPPAIHMLLAVMSFLIVFGAMLVHYDNAAAGVLVVGAIAFVLTLYWQVATNLDNPLCGAWYINEVPPEWCEQARREGAASSSGTLHHLLPVAMPPGASPGPGGSPRDASPPANPPSTSFPP